MYTPIFTIVVKFKMVLNYTISIISTGFFKGMINLVPHGEVNPTSYTPGQVFGHFLPIGT